MAFIRVPYGTNGLPLTITPPAGYAKVADYPAGTYMPPISGEVEQADAYFIGGDINAWSDDGTTKKPLSHAEQKAHINGAYNLWIMWNTEKNQAEYAVQWAFDKGWKDSSLSRLIQFFGGTPDGGHIIIMRDEDGNALYDENGNVLYMNP